MPNYLAPNYLTYAPPNAMLGMASGIQNLQAQQMQNRLTAGKIALGNIMAQNINPDGTINQQGVMAAIQANPVVGPYAQDAFLQGQARPTAVAGTQSAQAGANVARLQQHVAHLNEIFRLAGSAKTPTDLVRVLRYGIDANTITPQQAADVITQAPSDPQKFPSWIQAMRRTVMTPHEQQLAVYGTPTQVNTGTSVLSGVTSPTGRFTGKTNVREAMPLAVQAQQVHAIAPAGIPGVLPGTPVNQSLPSALAQEGLNLPTQPSVQQLNGPPGASGGTPTPTAIERFQNMQVQLQALRGQGGAPTAPAGLPQAPGGNSLISPPLPRTPQNALTGENGAPIPAYPNAQSAIYARLRAAGVPHAQAVQQALAVTQQDTNGTPIVVAPAAPPASAAQTRYVQTGFVPGQAEAMQSYATAGADMRNRWIAEAAEAPQIIGTLSQISAEVKSANPGPMNTQMARLGGLLHEFGIGNGGSATATQIWQKGVAQLLTQVAGATGVRSDMSLATAIEGMPHPTTTPEAALAAQAAIGGMQMYRIKRAQAYQSAVSANPTLTPQDFALQWAKEIPNPSVYSFNSLPVEIRKRWINSMAKSKADLAAFTLSLKNAGITPDLPADKLQK